MSKLSAIERAIEGLGGLQAFADAVGETKQAANQWRARGQVPANKALRVEAITGISRRELRPDWADYWPELSEAA